MTKFVDRNCTGYDTVVGEIYRWAKAVREEGTYITVLQEGTR